MVEAIIDIIKGHFGEEVCNLIVNGFQKKDTEILLDCFEAYIEREKSTREEPGCIIDKKAILDTDSMKISPELDVDILIRNLAPVFDKCIRTDDIDEARRIKQNICTDYRDKMKHNIELYHIFNEIKNTGEKQEEKLNQIIRFLERDYEVENQECKNDKVCSFELIINVDNNEFVSVSEEMQLKLQRYYSKLVNANSDDIEIIINDNLQIENENNLRPLIEKIENDVLLSQEEDIHYNYYIKKRNAFNTKAQREIKAIKLFLFNKCVKSYYTNYSSSQNLITVIKTIITEDRKLSYRSEDYEGKIRLEASIRGCVNLGIKTDYYYFDFLIDRHYIKDNDRMLQFTLRFGDWLDFKPEGIVYCVLPALCLMLSRQNIDLEDEYISNIDKYVFGLK